MHPHHFSAYFILFFIFIQNNFITSKELRFTDIHFDPSLNVGSNLTNDKIIRKRANNYYEANHDNAKSGISGIFNFEVKGEVKYGGLATIHEYKMTTGIGFCTVYQDKIYFITREELIKFRTRYHRKDLIFFRYYLELIWALRRINEENTQNYCKSRETNDNMYKFEVNIYAISNKDGKYFKLKIENVMQQIDLAILSFEEESKIDSKSCLKFDESGKLPPNGKVQTFIINGSHTGTVVEGTVKNITDRCRSVFHFSLPALKKNINTFQKNPGYPLLNKHGEVVGIDGETDITQTLTGKTLSEIIQNHHERKKSALYHFKGINLGFLPKKPNDSVLVLASNNSKLKRGDYIKQCNGVPIDDLTSLNALLLFESYNQRSFQISCKISRGNKSVEVNELLVETMDPNDLTNFYEQVNCGDSPTPEYDSNTLRGKKIEDYLIFGLNVDCEKVLNRTVNYANPLERTIEEVRSTSLLIKSTVSVTLGNKETTCHLMSGSAFITKQNDKYYVVSNQHVILSKNDVTSPVMKLCVDQVKDLINTAALKDSFCKNTDFKFDANFIVRAKTNGDEFILKNPERNVNSIKMLDVVVTTFLNETIPPGFLEFANDAPKLNDDVISIGNQGEILQTFSVGKVTEDSKEIQTGYFGSRHAIDIWTYGDNSGAAIVRADKKVIGLDGCGGNERTHSLTAPFLHKLVKSFHEYEKIMLFHPLGVKLNWTYYDRNNVRAQIIKKIDISLNQSLQVGDEIIKINNENISNPDDIVIASTIASGENLQRTSINEEVRYVSHVTMNVIRNGRNMTLGNVPIADLSYAELDEIDNIITGVPKFDFILEVRKQVCGNNMKTTPKQTTKTVNKVTMNPTPKQTTKTVKKPGLKTFATSNNPRIYTFPTPFTSTFSTPYETDDDIFSKTIIDTYTIYTTPLSTYSNSKYNSSSKPSSFNHNYVIVIIVVCILFGIAILIVFIKIFRSTKIRIRINCFSKGSSTEDDSFDQSTLNETLNDKIKNFVKSIIPKK